MEKLEAARLSRTGQAAMRREVVSLPPPSGTLLPRVDKSPRSQQGRDSLRGDLLERNGKLRFKV